ncbi:helix-turn-helix domain-containing protein [Microvirga sp. 2YAF29]|uniref:helix-turn-helix domain-containing protein n=1 Tax=Microvirga sp. 2YAF29 TaxID=3233031 RepID=UPI003F9D1FA8
MQTAHVSLNTQIAPNAVLLRSIPSPQTSPELGMARTAAKDEEIFAEGDRAAYFYKVASGAVRTFKLLSDGRRQIDAFHLPGDIFGLETGEEHRFSAEAVGDATIIAFRRRSLESLALKDQVFAHQVIASMMQALGRAQSHMLLLGRKNALEKIATFLLVLSARLTENGHMDLPMSRIDIADHLGLTIETVSRSLTQLERQSIIELPAHRRSIILRDKAALERLDT